MLKGTLTRLILLYSISASYPLSLQEVQILVGSFGLHLKGHPDINSLFGRTSWNAFTRSDFPDPLGPEIRAPPIVGSIALSMRTVFASSCPTIALKGKMFA
jgi:hypothetical protein